jgi:hypothetical protein
MTLTHIARDDELPAPKCSSSPRIDRGGTACIAPSIPTGYSGCSLAGASNFWRHWQQGGSRISQRHAACRYSTGGAQVQMQEGAAEL